MNLVLFSEYLSDASWTQTLTTISARTLRDGPYKTQPLQTIDFQVGGSISKNINLVNTGYEYSVFVKKGSVGFVKLTLGTASLILDVANSTIASTTGNNYSKVEAYQNDFIRVIGRTVIPSAGSRLFKIEPVEDSTGAAISSDINGVIIYGPQVIEGLLESYRSYFPTRDGSFLRATKNGSLSDPTVWHTGVVPQDGDYLCSGPYRVAINIDCIANFDATRTTFMAAGGSTFTQQASYGFSIASGLDLSIIGCFTGSPVPGNATYAQFMITHPTNFTLYGDVWSHPTDFITTSTGSNSIIRISVTGTAPDQISNIKVRNTYFPLSTSSSSYKWNVFRFSKGGSYHSNTVNIETENVKSYGLIPLRSSNFIVDDGSFSVGTDKIVWTLNGKLDFPGDYSYYSSLDVFPLHLVVKNSDFLNPLLDTSTGSSANLNPLRAIRGLTQVFENGIYLNTSIIPSTKTSGKDFAFNISNAIVYGDYNITGRPTSSSIYVYGSLLIKGDLYVERGLNTTNTYTSGTNYYSSDTNSVLNISSNSIDITVEGDFIYRDESGRTQLYTSINSSSYPLGLIAYYSGGTSGRGTFKVMGNIKSIGWGVPFFISRGPSKMAGKIHVMGDVDFSESKSNYSTSVSGCYTSALLVETYYTSTESSIVPANVRIDGDLMSMPSTYRSSTPIIYARVEDSYRAIDIRGIYYHNSRAALVEDLGSVRNTNDSIFINEVVISDNGSSKISPVVSSSHNVTVAGKITNTSSINTSTGIPGRLRIIGKDNGAEAPMLKISNSTTTHTVLSETVENNVNENDVRFGVVYNQVKVGTLKVPPAATVLKDIPVGQGLGTLEVGGSGGSSIDYTARFDSIDSGLEELKDHSSLIISMVEDI